MRVPWWLSMELHERAQVSLVGTFYHPYDSRTTAGFTLIQDAPQWEWASSVTPPVIPQKDEDVPLAEWSTRDLLDRLREEVERY